MPSNFALLILALMGAALAWGCGASEDRSASEDPKAVTSDGGRFTVQALASPTRASRDIPLLIRNAESQLPAEGLEILAVPWMSAMGHGSSVHAAVLSRGSGIYDLTDLSFYMPGSWEVRLKLQLGISASQDGGAAPPLTDSDSAVLVFDVR